MGDYETSGVGSLMCFKEGGLLSFPVFHVTHQIFTAPSTQGNFMTSDKYCCCSAPQNVIQ